MRSVLRQQAENRLVADQLLQPENLFCACACWPPRPRVCLYAFERCVVRISFLSASPESPLHLSLHSFQSTADGEHKAHFELAGNDDLPQRHLHLIALQNSVHIER
jgi:hypothetical protein